ncbi:hypothetical protein L596_016773 [Steinernema carpocapsae]|uniref:Uncharacterized protein n=1 Tax=Steinernema carpocapsae TaxID=34508 RepID=A0A4U5NJX7_STECR|nr:hypothetical protein L596_016773 [Steinernema carpocapsae]
MSRFHNCPKNADCIQRLCVCLPGFTAHNEQCVRPGEVLLKASEASKTIRGRMRKMGAICGKFDDCTGGTECLDGRCRCPAKYQMIGGRCRIEALTQGISIAGADCSQGQICSGGSVCDYNSKKCICAAGHIFKLGICRSKEGPNLVPAGAACTHNDTCNAGLRCIRGTCSCTKGQGLSDGYCRFQNSDVRLRNTGGLQFSSRPEQERLMAERCPDDPEKCRLPNCFCSRRGKTAPGNLFPEQIPQFVVLTFDDAVNARTMLDYKKLFSTVKYRNPNGCPVKATFFVSHEWTNYNLVQWLSEEGHEIASNSITHTSLQNKGRVKWLNEMEGQRRILAKFGNVPEKDVIGMRSPQTTLGGDEQFEMMLSAGFLYDNSVSANPALHEPPYWPQTLDYKLAWDCTQVDCPNGTFPGIWEIPMNQFQGDYVREQDTFKTSAILRGAVDLNASVSHLENLLMTNFEKSYHSNKAPYVLTLNADFLQLDESTKGMDALVRFLDKISKNQDVYFVTLHQLIEWMQNPLPLSDMRKASYLKCPDNEAPNIQVACAKPNKCMYRTPHLNSPERQFETCNLCPDYYPWIGNPTGSIIF